MAKTSSTNLPETPDPRFYFDEKAADIYERFFERVITHVKGEWAGKPFHLEDWQRLFIRRLFGWKRTEDGTRRYRKVYLSMGRKNGKTEMSAGIALALLVLDGEPGAEVYSAAADREQAGICFDMARQMALNHPGLTDMLTLYRSEMRYPKIGARYKAISAEAYSKHGFNAHGVIFDELHAQPNRELYDVLVTSMGARRQPLIVMITTAGFDRHSLCWEMYDYAKKVQVGIVSDPHFLPCIFEAEIDDDWTSEDVWRKANPNYGLALKPDYFRAQVAEAKESPSKENTFKRLHLNMWTEQDVRWLSMDKWDECAGELREDALEGRECFAGLDLAVTTDIAALSLVFPRDGGGFDVLCRFWVPEEGARRRERKDRVPYFDWIAQGLIKATPGPTIDYTVIHEDIRQLSERYNIREVAIDRYNASPTISTLQGFGLTVVPFGQGFLDMTAPTKELERLVLNGRLNHGGNAVLRWMASNVAAEMDASGNIKPSKKKSIEKIDGIVATIMALGRALVAEVSEGEPMWMKEGGIITI